MDPRRLSLGEWIAGAAAVLLIVSLFLPWYSAGGDDVTAWQAMAVDDVLLALAAVLALVAIAADTVARWFGFSVALLSLASIGAVLGLILTLFRLADPAPPVDVSLAVGAWLGLAASLGLAGGLIAGMRDQGPARRKPETERAAAAAALARAELLPLPGTPGPKGAGGGPA